MFEFRPSLAILLAAPFVAALSAPIAGAQGDRQSPDISREQMWRAPTAEEWARPCLITWERTWEDAVAVAQQTNKPILVCINMDGEIASEHYAGVRYREPDVAGLYEPYVCVIASVYRHTPRDHDDEGNRIECPRFGTVTCGEHIRIEPFLYERFMEGKRISPRHIMVELDEGETYDVYYAWDTQSVFDTITDGIAQRDKGPVTEIRGDRPILERVASRHVDDRRAVERAYKDGDTAMQRALLEAALQSPEAVSPDLLRLAVFGLDGELADLARQVLAKATDASAVELLGDTLSTSLPAADKQGLVAALERIGQSDPKARTLATVHSGLGRRSAAVDNEAWAAALAAQYEPAPMIAPEVMSRRLADQNEILERDDPAATLELAASFLVQAMEGDNDEDFTRLLLLDARQTATKAERLGATGWQLDAVLSVTAFYLDDREESYRRAEAAVKAMPSGETSWNAMAVLDLFAKMRWKAIADAARAKERWDPEWLTDIQAAHAVLLKHPMGTDQQVVWLYDRLAWLGARGQARRAIEQGLRRFPDSADLHDRLRTSALKEGGVDGLLATYDALLGPDDAPKAFRWFAGYASLVAAEFHRRQGDGAAAREAYDRGIREFEAYAEASPQDAASSHHYVALALAAKARLALEARDLDVATERILDAFARSPASGGSVDGLGLTPVQTATTLIARATEAERDDLAERVRDALAALPPEALVPPEYERNNPPPPADGGRGRLRPRDGGANGAGRPDRRTPGNRPGTNGQGTGGQGTGGQGTGGQGTGGQGTGGG